MSDAYTQDAAARQADIAALEHNFPGVQIWFGCYTRRWWAVYGGRLFEGRTPAHIGEQIFRACQRMQSSANVHGADPRPPVPPGGWGGPRPVQCDCRYQCVCRS